jgi:general stress protein 26
MNLTTQELDPKAFDKLRHLIEEIDVAMVTTVTQEGALRSRPMVTLELGDDGQLWFFTADDSGKVHDIAAEHAVNISYADSTLQRYVSATGNASIMHDAAKARELWEPRLCRYFPRGLEDPQLALLCVRLESAEYWDYSPQPGEPLGATAYDETKDGRGEHEAHTKVDIRATPSAG